MTNEEILELIGGQSAVRDYLRGVEEDSETDRDAHRAMLSAIASATASGITPAMARAEPELYGQYCLLLCRLWTDAEDGAAEAIVRQTNVLVLQLRHDARNVTE